MSLVVKYLSICMSSLGVLLHMLAVSLTQYAALISAAAQCSKLVMHIIVVGSAQRMLVLNHVVCAYPQYLIKAVLALQMPSDTQYQGCHTHQREQ